MCIKFYILFMYELKVVINIFGNVYKGLCLGLLFFLNKNLIYVLDLFLMKKKIIDYFNFIINKFLNVIILEKILYNYIY